MATSLQAPGQPVFRFAPSPNGALHLGHALSALTNERFAQGWGGRLLLRIEDIDTTRCTPALEQAVRADLDWLGIAFDAAVRRQSRHGADYAAALEPLRARGLVYACFCSRRQVDEAVAAREAHTGAPWPHDPDGAPLYPGCCRRLSPDEVGRRVAAGRPHALRLAMDAALAALVSRPGYTRFNEARANTQVAAQPSSWGDVVLARRDIATSYHLSVVVDDALQGVSHVVRGRDLEAATDVHVVLQQLLGLPTPLYHFHRLLTDRDGQKLAKSRRSESLADLRAQGVSAADLRARLGFA